MRTAANTEVLARAKIYVRVMPCGNDYEAWIFRGNRAIKRGARVNRRLALDASRLGQDVVGEMVDTVLRSIERGLTADRVRKDTANSRI